MSSVTYLEAPLSRLRPTYINIRTLERTLVSRDRRRQSTTCSYRQSTRTSPHHAYHIPTVDRTMTIKLVLWVAGILGSIVCSASSSSSPVDSSACSLTTGYDYRGGDLEPLLGRNASNAIDCCDLCSRTVGCAFFSFDRNTNFSCGDGCCWLKSSRGSIVANRAVVSGSTGVSMMDSGGCSSNSDCQLNGICSDAGVCICDAAWKGENCKTLAVLPTPVDSGYRHPNITSWGGNAYFDGTLYHGFFSEMVNHCGMDTWGINSRIVHAVSKTAVGPYVFHDEALNPNAHNAHISRDPLSGLYLLYHIHVPNKTCIAPHYNCSFTCKNGSTPLPYPPSMNSGNTIIVNINGTNAIVDADPHHHPGLGEVNWTINSGALHSSSSPYGPWVGVRGNVGCENPSPFFLPDGRVVRVCAGHNYQPQVDFAQNFTAPYSVKFNITCPKLHNNVTKDGEFHSEDAVLWIDHRGGYHALSHAMGPWPMPDGVHMFSSDGFNWTCADQPPYNGTIVYEDGSRVDASHRERPKVLLNARGELEVLFTGVAPYNGKGGTHVDDYAFTSAVPIQQSNAYGHELR
eukprot:m.164279 g.164279  ORF g.164279 m.164279 type:complete len:571 (-) comp31332_c0_seq2:80-1792(-)